MQNLIRFFCKKENRFVSLLPMRGGSTSQPPVRIAGEARARRGRRAPLIRGLHLLHLLFCWLARARSLSLPPVRLAQHAPCLLQAKRARIACKITPRLCFAWLRRSIIPSLFHAPWRSAATDYIGSITTRRRPPWPPAADESRPRPTHGHQRPRVVAVAIS